MDFTTIATVGLCAIMIGIVFHFCAFVFYRWIYARYKKETEPLSAQDMLETLTTVITSEISIIENDIFARFGDTLDNQSFENYYQYLSRKCLNDLSPIFLNKASSIMTQEAIADFTCKIISNYLKKKLAHGEPNVEVEEET